MPEPNGRTLAALNRAGYSFSELAERHNITRGKVAGLVKRYKDEEKDSRRKFGVKLSTPWELQGDYVVIGDVHVPCTDYDLAPLVIHTAKKHKVKRLIVAGDMFNMDAFSFYPAIGPESSWSQERDAARILIKHWLKYFEEVYFLMGNHDRRLQKWANGEFDESDIYGMITSSGKCHYSNRGWCIVRTKAQYPWRITHSRNYSVNQLTVAGELANKYQSNVISHHEHHLAKGWDKYKRFVIVNNGGLFDADKFAYAVMDDSKSPGMARGWTVLQNGVAHVYGEYPYTDWSDVNEV
jgi:hypothetical protein